MRGLGVVVIVGRCYRDVYFSCSCRVSAQRLDLPIWCKASTCREKDMQRDRERRGRLCSEGRHLQGVNVQREFPRTADRKDRNLLEHMHELFRSQSEEVQCAITYRVSDANNCQH